MHAKLSYPHFFKVATGNDPYDWQTRLIDIPLVSTKLPTPFSKPFSAPAPKSPDTG